MALTDAQGQETACKYQKGNTMLQTQGSTYLIEQGHSRCARLATLAYAHPTDVSPHSCMHTDAHPTLT